jgi:hypothetical protein
VNDLRWPDGRWMPIGLDPETMMWLWLARGLGPSLAIIRGHAGVWLEVET